MYIYPRVRDLREDHDLTQANVAKYLGVGTTTYRRWETGEHELPIHVLIDLCKLYKVTSDYLIGLSNGPKIKIK